MRKIHAWSVLVSFISKRFAPASPLRPKLEVGFLRRARPSAKATRGGVRQPP